ncbi:glycosyltransferase [Acetobacterium malicum]|uniref:Glycosyltransferase n=1 Tax=Acetobacterium malicum TaxID=52692 RepID=A0ABR6YU93_9FIRM|nr:glycosyltransferase family 2 protein [Acetobacterium malicum]MBC3898675.1 glycosyltransferase [Acetobacterium malicum]
MNEKICAGIVLFNPDIDRLKENITSIVEQVQAIYLQDNGSSNISQIEEYLAKEKKVVLSRNSTNKGIAWALNRICERGLQDGFEWIITLDQDSVCPENMVSGFESYLKNADMLCPKIVDRNYGLLDGSERKTEIIKECITSGCLLYLKSWVSINGFDEVMFIDGVDFEFCYRMNKAGMKILRVNGVVLYHEIGSISIRKFLGLKVIVKNHSAFRKYYIAKNIIYMARKRKNFPLLIKGIFQEVKLGGIVLLYEDDKKAKLGSVIKGIYDGITIQISR